MAVPAPAGPVARDAFAAGLKVLESRYRVVYDEALFTRTGYLAGDDARRADELNRYFADPDVRAILPARGGYGLMRILPMLDAGALRADPKAIVGFSDLTALHAWCGLDGGVRPIHGPMLLQLGKLPAEDAAWLWRLLEDPSPAGAIPAPGAARLAPGVPGAQGAIDGRVVGGNLEMIRSLVGTPWELELAGALLLVEEVGERPYRLDRMLTQLALAGSLAGVRGALVGDLTRCAEPEDTPPGPLAVIAERLAAFGIPGIAGLPLGHGDRNLALPIGARATLDLTSARLVLEEGAVG